jgi:transposase InsO family protein
MGKKTKTKTGVGKARRRTRGYPHEFRLQIVRLYLEEGYNTSVLREQFGVSNHSVHRWAKAYRRQGAEGLVAKLPPGAKPKLTEAVKNQIVGLKKSHPEYGPWRIAAVLRRFFLVSASATSVGLYRSQTAEHVLETYRRGAAEYGVPREMLTDNGRQYTNWRGKTRFEREMQKDRVKHIRSRPHHPMTLGKIERFLKSIQSEFLFRAQFDGFEQAVERTAYWIKYYNYKRAHQGIGGLCPADRFFEIAHDLRCTLERGVEENALELALRGRPVDPFYMVGRMGGQSVVIRAEKGKVRMLVDGKDQQLKKELVYDARKDITNEDDQRTPQNIRAATENNGRVVDLDRAAPNGADVSGDGHQPGAVGPVAEPCHRGDAQSPGSEEEGSFAASQSQALTADRKKAGRSRREAGEAAQDDPESETDPYNLVEGGLKTLELAADSPPEGRGDHESALRAHECQPSGHPSGDLPQDLLQMGAAGTGRAFGQPGGSAPGSPCSAARSRYGMC